jgi:hypothetical protein
MQFYLQVRGPPLNLALRVIYLSKLSKVVCYVPFVIKSDSLHSKVQQSMELGRLHPLNFIVKLC